MNGIEQILAGGRLIGGDGPTPEQVAMYQEQQRLIHIEMYRQATAQQCLVAMIVKSMAQEIDGEPVSSKVLAKRAKQAADALCVEFFGEDGAANV